ncbi:SDR family NAD(P)-dependent oxidoreductase [Hymenobacter tibetensis]|uniref:SDR family NAD(P)-dependent oxidoreductase n=1 Tax=Hymenobacter tibetensis TaxID=497967 RepID=A0ABY4CTS0_9BACT|nr:SDR family NAD(P)-dependent oxidoreductase [Hymenobacter tibetensis]UOG73432.1 SDR family NAD(P)-dependent oxidoreductase [Hymenobacter tibetensis]
MELKNNTVLITGGTSGFGLEFTKRFLELGNTVLITGRNPAKLAETKKLFPQVHTFQSDISKPEDIQALYQQVLERFPDLNILINNAGEMRKLVLHDEHDLLDITREIEINLMGPIRIIQQFLPHLKKKSAAAILNVTSGIALMAFPIAPVYGATKSGLRSYTQSLRVQLKNTSIKVFELVAPGSPTPLNDKFKELDGFSSSGMLAPEKIVAAAIKAMQQDKWEIYPGLLRAIRFVIRLAPQFVLAQASKIGASAMQGK